MKKENKSQNFTNIAIFHAKITTFVTGVDVVSEYFTIVVILRSEITTIVKSCLLVEIFWDIIRYGLLMCIASSDFF